MPLQSQLGRAFETRVAELGGEASSTGTRPVVVDGLRSGLWAPRPHPTVAFVPYITTSTSDSLDVGSEGGRSFALVIGGLGHKSGRATLVPRATTSNEESSRLGGYIAPNIRLTVAGGRDIEQRSTASLRDALTAGRVTSAGLMLAAGIMTAARVRALSAAAEYKPRTALGARLLEIRKRILKNTAIPLLSGADAVSEELRSRRGAVR